MLMKDERRSRTHQETNGTKLWIKGRQNVNEGEDTSDVILIEGGE
jgi:hypothetical protein